MTLCDRDLKNHDINAIMLSGKVIRTGNLREGKGTSLTLAVHMPALYGRRGEIYKDYPTVDILGEPGEELRHLLHEGDYATVVGYVREQKVTLMVGENKTKHLWMSKVIPNRVMKVSGKAGNNCVILSGTVTDVFVKMTGKVPFYSATVIAQREGKDPVRATYACFGAQECDIPRAGDYVFAECRLQTKEELWPDDSHRRNKLTSLVARSVSVERRTDEA
ncbi:MAG: hypothetical protein Q4B59_01940 [Lachnospiraceae bacterium]|nr:hypothetical protein [Lachnospiraceae bacterium]